MRADDLILFSQVIELGSFSKVAEKNNLTNSVVSKRIARLEQNAGTQLLYRTTRKLSLTEAGKILLNKAKSVTQATEEAKKAVSGLGQNISGHIKMSVPTISGELILADAVAEFCNQNPGLSVDMSLENRFVDLISGGYDVVIRTGYLEDSSLIARHIIDSQWVVCASPSYIAQNGKLHHPRELVKHNCLQYAYQTTGASEWQFKGADGNYLVKVSGGFSTNNATALRRSALGGHGIAYVPRCLVYDDFLNGDLIDIFPDLVGKKLGIYAVYPFTRQPPNKVKRLIEHIRQRYLALGHCF
ncbi:LysR family transcriptional regulator [Vibrio rarus]|uniref:LysR family transcriptional regulator n=1 Tax=Vibrio rarus TaxID=413403 RepID=UPI0021C3FF47|nr:LysR family transcriptional regulator [Vibrio rarus]